MTSGKLSAASKVLAVACLCAMPGIAGAADVKLANYFGDDMVLQREQPVTIWGAANPNASVTVKLGTQSRTTTADGEGRWKAVFDPLKPGSPLTLEATGDGKTASAKNILVGDVWLCSGQSNMQMSLKESVGSDKAAEDAAKFSNLRFCTVSKGASDKPEWKAEIKWKTSTPQNAKDFSAVGYYFIRDLMKDPSLKDVPIGVIDSTFGGTTVEGWTPARGVANLPEKDIQPSMFGIKATSLYNWMINPLQPGPVKGVVWYQGEGNSGRPDLYAGKLKTMMTTWREGFGNDKLPFVIVSLPDHTSRWGDLYWCWFREAQAQAVKETPNSYIALAINTTDGTDLHPKEKYEIGQRAALLVRKHVYGSNIVADGPTMKDVKIGDGKARVTFETAGDKLAAGGGGPVHGFMVAGADGQYYNADATIDGDAVVLSTKDVPQPKTVRYAWAGVPHSTLVNSAGLPAYPFRTDDLTPGNRENIVQQPDRLIEAGTYQAVVGANGMVKSFAVGGKQFLSSDPGANGGTSIPVMFGSRNLSKTVELAPDVLLCSDNQVSLKLVFGDKDATWTVANNDKGDIQFRIALSPGVNVSDRSSDGTVTVTRDRSILTVSGVDKINKHDDFKMLEVTVKGGGSKTLKLSANMQ